MTHGELWPYSERASVGTSSDVEVLFSEPEVYLNEAEKQTVYAFATGLFNGHLSDELQILPAAIPAPEQSSATSPSLSSLEQIYQVSIESSSQSFSLESFKTAEGYEDLLLLCGKAPEDVATTLYGLVITQQPDPKLRKEIASRSRNWYSQ